MKKILLLLIGIILTGCNQNKSFKEYAVKGIEVHWSNFVKYIDYDRPNDIMYDKYMRPYTGKAYTPIEVGSGSFYGEFLDGQASGKILSWFPNGKKNYEGTFLSNKNHGEELYWDENGNLTSKINYKYGLRDGLCQQWENKNLVYSGNFKRGEKNGKHSIWYSNGKLWKVQNWSRDILINSKEYYENGVEK